MHGSTRTRRPSSWHAECAPGPAGRYALRGARLVALCLLACGSGACVEMQGVDHSARGAGASRATHIEMAGARSSGGGNDAHDDEEPSPGMAGTWNVGPGAWGAGGGRSSGQRPTSTGVGGMSGRSAAAGPSSASGDVASAEVPAGGCTPAQVFQLPVAAGGSRPAVDPVGQEALCIAISGPIAGWECHGLDGRAVTVNGKAATCGATTTLPAALDDGFRYFEIAAIPTSTAPIYYTGGVGWW